MLIVAASNREPIFIQDDPLLEEDVCRIAEQAVRLSPECRRVVLRCAAKMRRIDPNKSVERIRR